MPKIWDVEHDLRLVALMKEREFMWNSKNVDYHYKRKQQKTYLEVAKLFGSLYTVSSIKDRWTSICATYHMNVKKLAKDHNETLPAWPLWEACQFLSQLDASQALKIEDICDDVPLGQFVKGEIPNFEDCDNNSGDAVSDTEDPTFSPENSKYEWGKEDDIRLLELIRKKEFFWNTKHRNYKNKALRSKALDQLADAMGGAITARAIQTRWKDIQNTFKLNFKEVERTQASTSEVQWEPTWHLWKQCQFMAKGMKTKRKWKSLRSQKIHTDNFSTLLVDTLPMDCDADDPRKRRKSAPLSSDISSASPCEALLKEALPLLASIRQEFQTLKYSGFGRQVSESLGKLPASEAETAKQKILELLNNFSSNGMTEAK